MAAEDNRQLVLKFYDLMSHLRFDEMFALVADDGVWTVAGNPDLFHHAGVATKAQRVGAFNNFTGVFASVRMEIRSTTAEGDRVAVEAITHCRTHGGLAYDNELFILVHCRDGKIQSIYEHLDQQTALAFDCKLQAELTGPN
jgi:ketosteroid isomerase-like protein